MDQVNLCAASSVESWALSSNCAAFSVALAQFIWDIYQLTTQICSYCCLQASCAYLYIPVYAKGLSLHFGKCFLFDCKGLGLELCEALKGEGKKITCSFSWAKKLHGNQRCCQPALHPVLLIYAVPSQLSLRPAVMT